MNNSCVCFTLSLKIVKKLRRALAFARKAKNLKRDAGADRLWCREYEKLSEGATGLFGAITARAEAQVVRLSCLYALLDCSCVIKAMHLRAALAVWKYCEQSARYIFGDSMGDPVADTIREARATAANGMTRTEISKMFSNHNSPAVDAALRTLLEQGKIRCIQETTGGVHESASVFCPTRRRTSPMPQMRLYGKP